MIFLETGFSGGKSQIAWIAWRAAVQLNFFMECGAVTISPDGLFDYDASKLAKAVPDLVNRIMTLEYEGSRDKATAFLDKYGILQESLMSRLAALDDIPYDIVCKFEAEEPGFFDNLS